MNGLVRDMRVPKDHDVGLWRDQRGARPRWKRYDMRHPNTCGSHLARHQDG